MRLFAIASIGFLLLALPASCGDLTVAIPAAAEKSDHLVLHFENLKLPPNSSGLVRVFADMPDANAQSDVNDERYLGYFTVLSKTSAEAAVGASRRDVTLDVSHKKQFLAGKKEITLTLVPAVTVGRAYLVAN